MDYCALATARSIPIAQDIATHFDALKLEHDIGPLKIKIQAASMPVDTITWAHWNFGIGSRRRRKLPNYAWGDGTETPAIGERAAPDLARMR